jgi:catechol 2,3-dioxygenase-like lactoylglutathione lyase family enzyme
MEAERIPELNGVLETALYVKDVEASVTFYVRVLGFKVIEADARITALAAKGTQVLLLCSRGASANLGATSHDATGQQHVAFAVPQSSLSSWRFHLDQLGVTIVHERKWSLGGESVYFRDPDNHLLELATPGVWSVY